MKKGKKILTLLLAVVMLITILPVQTQAASKGKLNKTKATIYVGSNTTLKLSETSKKITWSTSKKSVAMVNSKGKVTAKKAGKATITAKVSGKKYNCKITVKNPYLSATSMNLTVKQRYTLKLTGTSVTKYSSSNRSIATVTSRGKITARKAGKTTITVRGQNGKTYKCKVTVKVIGTVCNSHDWDNGTVTKEATYTLTGTKKYTCTKCGKTKDEVIPALVCCSHSWDSGVITKIATGKETGVMTYTCTKCGKTRTEDIPICAHTYRWVRTKEPTATEDGLKEHKCTQCGDIDTTEIIPKLTIETDWVYSGNTRTKTMADGTVFTENKVDTAAGSVWGYYDDTAARQMFDAIVLMQSQQAGWTPATWGDAEMVAYAKAQVANYAAAGYNFTKFHMNAGGMPNIDKNKTRITISDSYGCAIAIACFVADSRSGHDQFTYGNDWRSYFGTYYASSV